METHASTHRSKYRVIAVVALVMITGWAVSLTDYVAAGPVQPVPTDAVHNAVVMCSMADLDHSKLVGPNACAECHASEAEAWKGTHHYRTFNEMHRTDEAKRIAKAMGIRSMKREGNCRDCHYTSPIANDKPTPAFGISCESCHAPAKDYKDLHSKKPDDETAAQAAHRMMKAAEAGMLRPSNIYAVAANCFGCHTVPQEKLVNTGGHRSGTEDFELVAWSQGEIRHNYQANQKVNAKPTQNRLRVLYVVGRAVDLEFSVRAASKITARGSYRDAVLARIRKATQNIDAVLNVADIPELATLLKPLKRSSSGSLALSRSLLTALPDRLATATKAFAKNNDGSNLATIDALLPKPADYKGTARP